MNLEDCIPKERILYNEPMKKHTTMRVGGNVDVLVVPETLEQLIFALAYAKEKNMPVKVLGCGSNVVVSDHGMDGMVIKITNRMQKITVQGECICASSGTGMPKLSRVARDYGLTGLEFACGIPGTVGGGTKMNAGAYGSEFANVVVSCKYLDDDLKICQTEKEKMEFGYRHTFFTEHPSYIILETTFQLMKGDKEQIQNKMNENTLARTSKQPITWPSAGSVFKRPEGYFVGKLVQDCGLRGYQIGGAQVSEKHTGFIINKDNATCEDIKNLISHIQKTVYQKFGVELKTEVEMIGRE